MKFEKVMMLNLLVGGGGYKVIQRFERLQRCLNKISNIFFSSGLRERDRFSRTTIPVCVLYIKSRGSRAWKEVGRTEKIENTFDPEWTKTFEIEYFFEEKQVGLIYFGFEV